MRAGHLWVEAAEMARGILFLVRKGREYDRLVVTETMSEVTPRLGFGQPSAISSREHDNDKAELSFSLLSFLTLQIVRQSLLLLKTWARSTVWRETAQKALRCFSSKRLDKIPVEHPVSMLTPYWASQGWTHTHHSSSAGTPSFHCRTPYCPGADACCTRLAGSESPGKQNHRLANAGDCSTQTLSLCLLVCV